MHVSEDKSLLRRDTLPLRGVVPDVLKAL